MSAKQKKVIHDLLILWLGRGREVYGELWNENQTIYYDELVDGVKNMIEAIEGSMYFEAKRKKARK